MSSVAGLLLAAGAGRRMGGPKALLPWAGRPLVEHGLATLLAGGCAPVLVVLGADADRVRGEADLRGGRIVVAAAWADGMGASLRAGLAALPTDVDAAVVALVDQPGVTPAAIARLRAATAAPCAVATYQGLPRNPVLLGRAHWAQVAAGARGDVGARAWLRAHPALVTPVECGDVSAADDLDTPADLARLTAAQP